MTTPLVVATTLTNGNICFAEVPRDATVQDVIDALLKQENIVSEALDGLPDEGWALQKIRTERHGRRWEDEALEALGDGTQPFSRIIDIVSSSGRYARSNDTRRAFTRRRISGTISAHILHVPYDRAPSQSRPSTGLPTPFPVNTRLTATGPRNTR